MDHSTATKASFAAMIVLVVAGIVPMTTAEAAQEDVSSGAFWKYHAEVEISSLNLEGAVTLTYKGAVDKDVEGTSYLLDLYEWKGKLDISGLYSAGIANGTARYRGMQYVSIDSGYDVLTDMNMSLNFTTCYGSLDQKTYHHWHHCTMSSLPPGGTGDEPSAKELGDNWTKTFSLHMRSRGTFWLGEFIDLNVTEERTYSYSVEGIGPVSVGAGDLDCTAIRSSQEKDVFVEWRSEKAGLPAMILKEYDFVNVYHSGEDWNMALESYDLYPSSLSDSVLGLGGIVGAIAVVIATFYLVWRRTSKKSQT